MQPVACIPVKREMGWKWPASLPGDGEATEASAVGIAMMQEEGSELQRFLNIQEHCKDCFDVNANASNASSSFRADIYRAELSSLTSLCKH